MNLRGTKNAAIFWATLYTVSSGGLQVLSTEYCPLPFHAVMSCNCFQLSSQDIYFYLSRSHSVLLCFGDEDTLQRCIDCSISARLTAVGL